MRSASPNQRHSPKRRPPYNDVASPRDGNDNSTDLGERSSKTSIFSETVDLYDPEKILEALDYAVKTDSEGKEGIHLRRFETLKAAVASLLPDTNAEDIEFRGPRIAGRDPDRSGVYVLTPSGFMPLANLSLGYQEMFAWIVDLAWRLFNAYPASPEPLSESAIVLIDEVDLHLHPRWQRNLRRCLLRQFPNVQFIATTHNPVTAQEALSEGGNIAVVRWAGREAHILNRPIPRREWRHDQLLASDLFGFGSDRSQEAEAKLTERIELIRNPNRSPEQENRLRELDEFVSSLPTARSPKCPEFRGIHDGFRKELSPSSTAMIRIHKGPAPLSLVRTGEAHDRELCAAYDHNPELYSLGDDPKPIVRTN